MLHAIYTDEAWNDVFSFDNVTDTVDCFTTVLQGLPLDLLVPLHGVRIKQDASPWGANSDVVSARRERDKLHRQALTSGDLILWQRYRSARNKFNHLLRKAKCSYLSGLASSTSGTSGRFWSHFRYMSR